MARRVLFYVQHLLGIGHWRRAVILGRAIAEAGLETTLLSGGMPEESRAAEPFRIIQLPPARAADAGFRMIVDGAGTPIDDAFRRMRREQVLAALADTRPDILLIEGFPFGRRAFRFELEPLIAAARAATPRPAVLCSIRDVLVAKSDPARIAEVLAAIERDFDGVLVHGDPAFVPLEASFPAAGQIAGKLRYTGYVVEAGATTAAAAPRRREVIVSAGGGAVGMPLYRAALAARPLTPLASAPWRILAGPHLPEPDFAALGAALPQGVALERFRADFPALLRHALLSISQAGYNTVLDILEARARAVVVPFAAGNETEQGLRAELLARAGVMEIVPEAELSGERLAAAIGRALAASPPQAPAIGRDGAARTAALLAGW
jgi:predicted glycosyltransferase